MNKADSCVSGQGKLFKGKSRKSVNSRRNSVELYADSGNLDFEKFGKLLAVKCRKIRKLKEKKFELEEKVESYSRKAKKLEVLQEISRKKDEDIKSIQNSIKNLPFTFPETSSIATRANITKLDWKLKSPYSSKFKTFRSTRKTFRSSSPKLPQTTSPNSSASPARSTSPASPSPSLSKIFIKAESILSSWKKLLN